MRKGREGWTGNSEGKRSHGVCGTVSISQLIDHVMVKVVPAHAFGLD